MSYQVSWLKQSVMNCNLIQNTKNNNTKLNWFQGVTVKLSITLFAIRDNSQYFSSVVASPAKQQHFIASILGIIMSYDLDGVDIDWEYPVKGGDKDGTPVCN